MASGPFPCTSYEVPIGMSPLDHPRVTRPRILNPDRGLIPSNSPLFGLGAYERSTSEPVFATVLKCPVCRRASICPNRFVQTGGVTESGTATRRESVTSKETVRGPVLVVDADPAVRRIVRLVLEGARWHTHTAADNPSAEALI